MGGDRHKKNLISIEFQPLIGGRNWGEPRSKANKTKETGNAFAIFVALNLINLPYEVGMLTIAYSLMAEIERNQKKSMVS